MGCIDPPTGPDGKSSMGVSLKTARIYAVSQKAIDEGKGPAIARLLEWMASDEGYYLLGFGVEGENYQLDAKGYITTEGIADAEKVDSQGNAAADPTRQHGLHLLRCRNAGPLPGLQDREWPRHGSEGLLRRISERSPSPSPPARQSSTRPPMPLTSSASTARTLSSSSSARNLSTRPPGLSISPVSTASAPKNWRLPRKKRCSRQGL